MKNFTRQFNNTLSRILKGLKLGFNLSLLPAKVERFHNNPFTRIFRVLGGISIILFLSSPSVFTIDNFFIYWTIFSLAMIHFSYIIIISFIKLWHLIYMWKNKKLEVRNSPLDHIASLAFKLAVCVKGACVAGGASATVLGLGLGVDKLLEESGNPPVFKKTVGKGLGNFLSAMGIKGNNEYIELQKQISEVKQKTKDINELTKIVNTIEKDDSFIEIKKDLRDFQVELIKEIEKEKNIKNIEQSKILNKLKDIKKNW